MPKLIKSFGAIMSELVKWKEHNRYELILRVKDFVSFNDREVNIALELVDLANNLESGNKRELNKLVTEYDKYTILFEEKRIWFRIINLIYNLSLIPIHETTEVTIDIEKLINYFMGYNISKEPLIHSYGRRVSKRFPTWVKQCQWCLLQTSYYGGFARCTHEGHICHVNKLTDQGDDRLVEQFRYKKSDMPTILSATIYWLDNEMMIDDFEGLRNDVTGEVGKYVCKDIRNIIMEYI